MCECFIFFPGMAIHERYRRILDSLWIPCVADSDPDSADSFGCGFGFLINPWIRILSFSYRSERKFLILAISTVDFKPEIKVLLVSQGSIPNN